MRKGMLHDGLNKVHFEMGKEALHNDAVRTNNEFCPSRWYEIYIDVNEF